MTSKKKFPSKLAPNDLSNLWRLFECCFDKTGLCNFESQTKCASSIASQCAALIWLMHRLICDMK